MKSILRNKAIYQCLSLVVASQFLACSKGSGSNSNAVIYLEGGAACQKIAEVANRYHDLEMVEEEELLGNPVLRDRARLYTQEMLAILEENPDDFTCVFKQNGETGEVSRFEFAAEVNKLKVMLGL